MVDTILVTGAGGFVAAHVIKELLLAGYKVKGTVRSESSAKKVTETHAAYAGDNLSFAYVQNIKAPGAFTEAVKGVDGIMHLASPFILDAKDYETELFIPAVSGTTAVLEAAATNPEMKRVIITSSFASVGDFQKGGRPGYVYTEADWNPMTREEALKADPSSAYLVSKALAEQAAWDFVKEKKPSFTIATLCPPMVYGPLVQEFDSMDKLNTSSADFWRLINGTTAEAPDTAFSAYSDVRDLALLHRLAYEVPEAANQRFLAQNEGFSYRLFCDILKEKLPELAPKIPKTDAPSDPFPEKIYKLDHSKATKVLGMKWRPIEETLVDTAKSLLALEKKLAT